MKGALLSLVLVGMVVMGLGAGTWAYFSDTETSSGNYIAAGTLDLVISDDGGTTWRDVGSGDHVYLTDVKPGDMGSTSFMIKNNGSVTGDLYIKFIITGEDSGYNMEPEGDTTADLAANIWVYVEFVGGNSYNMSLADWNAAGYKLLKDGIVGGGTGTINVEAGILSSVGNEIQDDSVTFDVELLLIQNGYSP